MKETGDFERRCKDEFEKYKDYLIDKGSDYICGTCNKVWYPTSADVNSKRLTHYFKGCTSCRLKSYAKNREYKQKKGNNYDKLYDVSSRRDAEGHQSV